MRLGDIDSWEITRQGITYRVDVTTDEDSNYGDITGNDEGLSPSDVEAHKRGDWLYVGVTVTPLVDGRAIDQAADSIWATQWGTMPAETEPWQGGQHEEIRIGRESIEEYPVPDLVSEARGNLEKFRASLGGLDLSD